MSTMLARSIGTAVIAASAAIFVPQPAAQAAPQPVVFSANVMAPLMVTDWGGFDSHLQAVKEYGVTGVSVDVWWGTVEKTDNAFDWTYYDTVFSHIADQGLDVVPILSFHQCGGNVGDDCDIPLPAWIWTKYQGSKLNGVSIGANGLKYKSEQGNLSTETVQAWADPLVENEYRDFAKAFKDHFAVAYKSLVREINVSLGPAGELRYPSYNGHDVGTGYPSRGALQSYSDLALVSFRDFALKKYSTLTAVNAAWNTQLASTSEISPPTNTDFFFLFKDYLTLTYGRDFVDWYNQSLVDHGKVMLKAVADGLGTGFASANIGYKIPGVHWSMADPQSPRAAEVTAGLIQTSIDHTADATGHGYQKIIGLAKTVDVGGRAVVLHFTCLEMDNQEFAPAYSQAEALVFWVAAEAQKQGIAIKGENALSGGVTSNAGWDNVENAFTWASYKGFTALRVADVATGTGRDRYAAFINKFRGPALVVVHYAEPEMASGNSFTTWNGIKANGPMVFEGTIEGRRWWVQTLVAPPAFSIGFYNSKNHTDFVERKYTAQSKNIYILPKDAEIYSSRPN